MGRSGRVGNMLAAALLGAALSFCHLPGASAQQNGATFVGVDAVKREPLLQTVPVVGRLVARQSGTVASRSAGPVAEVLVKVGDRVKKGEVLVRLVTETLKAQLDLRLAELVRAQQELERIERLRATKSAAFQASRYDTLVQDVARARAQLRVAQIELNNAEIRAPYPGVITIKHTETGAYLKVGDPVVAMVDDGQIEIEADVPVARIAGLATGAEVKFVVEGRAGSPYRARVRAVVPVENPLTRTRAVRFLPEDRFSRDGIAVNQSVTVEVPVSAARDVVSVHKDAVITRGDRTIVFVVDGKVATVRPVRLGEAIGGRFEVLAGLRPGDLVVVRGNERLRPGQPVRYRAAD